MQRSGLRHSGPALLAAILLAAGARADTFTLTEASIGQMQRAMASGDVTCVDLAALYFHRILAYDRRGPRLNAVAQLNPRLFTEAAELDRLRAQGIVLGPLHGVPVLVKDSYDVAGLATAAGATPLKGLIAQQDAPIVRRLREAGALVLGKSNMWAFAYAGPFDSPRRYAWGRARNPYTLVEDFGGSSTGSAAATAANLCGFAMGGDTGSSIRLPCARSALVGGRPSLFLVPASGTFPTNITLDVLGPMTRTVSDYARVMDVVVFDDPEPVAPAVFPPSSSVRPATYTSTLRPNALRGKVVGLPRPYIGRDPAGPPLDPAVQSVWDAAVDRLRRLGATVKEIDWPFFHRFSLTDLDRPLGYASVGLTRTQFTLTWQWVDAYYFNEHLEAYGDRRVPNIFALPDPAPAEDPDNIDKITGFKRFIRDGRAKPFAAYRFDDYYAAYRRWARRDVENVMKAEGVDLLAFPAAGGDDPGDDRFTFLNAMPEGTFLGLPQISVPAGFSATGRPVGMMLMARTHYTEAEILGYAYAFERSGPLRRPPTTTPPLPGETITFNPGNRADQRAEIDPPRVAPASPARRVASGAIVIRGRVTDASPLLSLRIAVNGRTVALQTAPRWTVRLTSARLRALLAGGQPGVVTIVAKDIHGNTTARAQRLRLPPRGSAG